MKQHLLNSLILLFALIAGTATSWAKDITFDFEDESAHRTEGNNSYSENSYTENGVTISLTYADAVTSGTPLAGTANVVGRIAKKEKNSPVVKVGAISISGKKVTGIAYKTIGMSAMNMSVEYSLNNSTWTNLQTIKGMPTSSTEKSVSDLNITGTSFYLRFTVTVASSTKKNRDFQLDDIVITLEDVKDNSTLSFTNATPSVTLSKTGSTYDAEYSQNVTVAPADYDGDITYSFVDASSTFDLNDATIDNETGGILISAAANIDAAKTIVVKASATATAKYNKPNDATYTLTVNPAPDGVGTPTFSLATGSYYYGTTFTISSANSSKIYYTTDGTTPSNTNGTLYSGAIAVNSDMTVKAIGYDGETASEVATINYTLKAPEAPTFSVAAGGVAEGTLLTLTVGDGGTKVVYTTDGTDPNASSDEYSSAIAINNPTTIKAASVDEGNNLSAIVTNAYTIVVTKEITLWSEDFSDYSADDVPSDGTYSYECADGASTTKIYGEKLAGGTSPELLVNKSGYFQATIPLDNISGNLILTYYTNNTNLTVSSTTEGVTLTGNINPIGSKSKSTVTINGVTTGMKSLVIKFVATGGNCRLDNIVLKANMQFSTEPVTVSAVGYATYCSANALDFTGSEVKAYVGTVSGGNLTFTPVTEVPANTGLLLYKEGGATVNVPVIASADPVGENCLTGVNEATAIDPEDYILNKVGENVGFYKAGSFTSLAAHRAYITALAATKIKNFVLNFDETDGIVEIMRNGDNEKMSAIYDLSGRRVVKPTKGLYIVNGKKVVK